MVEVLLFHWVIPFCSTGCNICRCWLVSNVLPIISCLLLSVCDHTVLSIGKFYILFVIFLFLKYALVTGKLSGPVTTMIELISHEY